MRMDIDKYSSEDANRDVDAALSRIVERLDLEDVEEIRFVKSVLSDMFFTGRRSFRPEFKVMSVKGEECIVQVFGQDEDGNPALHSERRMIEGDRMIFNSGE